MRRLWVLTVLALAIGVGVDVAMDVSVPGLTAGIGFGGCAVIVIASKWLGRALLQRPEAYYADPDVAEGLDGG